MQSGRFVFSQLMDFLPKYEFNKCVRRYRGDHRVRTFSCYDQFLCMAFGQLTQRDSLRDVVLNLSAHPSKLFHLGFRSKVARSTLADANERRDWRIFADFAQVLIAEARRLYAHEDMGVEVTNTVYALDSTTIDLCLSLFPWAPFQKTKSAIKLHTLLNLRGSIPEFIRISSGKEYDARVLDSLPLTPGAIYVMDRGYLHFKRLYHVHQQAAYFVTRAQRGFQFKLQRSHPVDKATGLRCDQHIKTDGTATRVTYPELLRRVRYRDPKTNKTFVYLTNNFTLPALTIAQLYKARWEIELFFKWIKQHLHIKSFYGVSENAVKTQIWIAACVYLLIAIMKKHLRLEQSMYTILQIASLSLFEKTPVLQAFSQHEDPDSNANLCNQLEFKDF